MRFKYEKIISIKELKRRFIYNRRGFLVRIAKTAPNTFIGQRVFGHTSGKNTKGPIYLRLRIKKKQIPIHVAIFALVHGRYPKNILDHKDTNSFNNCIGNLREATHTQNSFNCGLNNRNKTGYRGIFWCPKRKVWRVILGAKNKYHYLGSYKKKSQAIKIQQKAVLKFHGRYKY